MLRDGLPKLGYVLPFKEVEPHDIFEDLAHTGPGASTFLLFYDHIILDTHDKPPEVEPRLYTSETAFLEPFVTIAALSQLEKHCQLITGVLVAPQRQTALLAQQAAHVSIISNGRLELGLGVGWNPAEYRALGRPFGKRGQILDSQIELLQRLWSEGSVNYSIGDEVIERMAINPRPESSIPLWVGGWSPQSITRAAKRASGWMPMDEPKRFAELKPLFLEQLRKNNRNPEEFRTMGRITLGTKSLEQCVEDYLYWINLGVTHIAVTTTGTKNSNSFFHKRLLGDFWRATRQYRDKD